MKVTSQFRHRGICLCTAAFLLLVSTSLAAQTATPSPPAFENFSITSGVPVEKELNLGQAHAFQLNLDPGQYLRITAPQKGINIGLILLSPSGQKLVDHDKWFGVSGLETFSVITEAGGVYRLEVRPGARVIGPGSYGLMAEWRTPNDKDRQQAAADKLFHEGDDLFLQDKAATRPLAIEKLNSARSLFHGIGDALGEAHTTATLGEVYNVIGDKVKTLELREQALVLWRAAGERKGEASTLSNLGAVHLTQGNNTTAIDYFNQAIAIYESLGEKVNVAIVRNNIAVIYHETGNYQQALPYYEQALATFREVNSKPEQIVFLRNIANVYAAWGDRQTAATWYAQALELARAIKSKRHEATVLQFIGNNSAKLGDTQQALQYLNQAIALHHELGNQFGEADALKTLGSFYYQTGKYDEAVEKFGASLAIAEPLKLPTIIANDQANLGHTYFALNDLARAREYLTKALEFFRPNGYRAQEAACLEMLGRIDMREGRLEEALRNLEPALEIIEATRQRISLPELRASYFALSRGVFDAYVDSLMQLHEQNPDGDYASRALAAAERSRARSLLDTLIEANADIKQGVDPKLLQQEKELLRRTRLQTNALRALSATSTDQQRAAVQKEYEGLLAEYKTLQGQLRASSPRYAALTQPSPLTLSEIRKQVLDQDSALLEYALGEKRSYLWVVTDKQLRTYTLAPGPEIEKTARLVYELMTTRNRVIKFETVEEKRTRIARADADYLQASAQLSKLLLGAAAADLDRQRLLIVSDGALQYINLGSLPVPGGNGYPLLGSHEVVSLPSASTLGVLRRELSGRPRAPKQVAVIADPVFGMSDERLAIAMSSRAKTPVLSAHRGLDELTRATTDFETAANELPRLSRTRLEAEGIAGLVPDRQGRIELDFAANRKNATSRELSEYRIVHFATHGLLNSRRPELSGLVFSLVDEKGQPQDGFLRLSDIYELKFPADLIVLSACRTGLGQEIRGEGLVGLTRGFMYAGAARVLVSLWNIDDAATAELMRRFYQEMLGPKKLSPAAALRSAQLTISKDPRWHAPYFWAGFVLQGEPR